MGFLQWDLYRPRLLEEAYSGSSREKMALGSARSPFFSCTRTCAQNGIALYYASDALKADRDFVLAAVGNNGCALLYASDALKADRGVVLAAMAHEGRALCFASVALRADREVVLAAVAQNGYALSHASDALKADRGVVLAAVAQNGSALTFASTAIHADQEIMLAAVAQDGTALQYASAALKADREVVLAAALAKTYPHKRKWAMALVYLGDDARAWDAAHTARLTELVKRAERDGDAAALQALDAKDVTETCKELDERLLPKVGRMVDLLRQELSNPTHCWSNPYSGFLLATPDGQVAFVRDPPRPSLEQWLTMLRTAPPTSKSITLAEAFEVAEMILALLTAPRMNPLTGKMDAPPCDLIETLKMF